MGFQNPTPSRSMQSILMPSHFHSQYCDLFPFPYHSHDPIPIPSHSHAQFVCRAEMDAKHYKIKIHTHTAKMRQAMYKINFVAKENRSTSQFSKELFSCHSCMLLCRNIKLFVESGLGSVRRFSSK